MARPKRAKRLPAVELGSGHCLGVCGRAERLAAGLGRADSYGAPTSARIFMDTAKGNRPRNKRGRRCAALPSTFRLETVDEVFERIRREQVTDFGATRYETRGWYQGGQAPGLVYEIFYSGGFDPKESSPRLFRRHMGELAEGLGRHFCQDSVLVEFSEPNKSGRVGKTTCAYSWDNVPADKKKPHATCYPEV